MDTAPPLPPASEATRQRAARDIAMQVVVRIVNLGLGVVVTAIVVRTLGASGYGQWSTLFIILGLVGYFVDFGMETVTVREAARSPEHEHEWVGALMLLRFVMLVPVILASVAVLLLLERSHQMLIAGLILLVTMPFGGVGATVVLFRVRVDNRIPMLVLTLRSILWGGAVIVISAIGGGIVALAIAMTVTNAIGSLVQLGGAMRLGAKWPRPSRERLFMLVRVGFPIGLAGVLITAYARIDQVIVFLIKGSQQAGLYGAVYNLVDQAHFVPISILTTLAPVLAASWPGNRERLLRASTLTAELLAVTSFGGLVFALFAAEPLVRLIFGPSFAQAASILPVLAGAFVFICFGYLQGNLALVLGLQQRLVHVSLAGLVVNVAGNLVLVPLVGYQGAAWMTLATEVVVLVLTLRLILRKLELSRPPLGRIGRTLAAAVVLGIVLGMLRLADAPLAVLVATTCVAYPALLFGFRALGTEDIRVVVGRASG